MRVRNKVNIGVKIGVVVCCIVDFNRSMTMIPPDDNDHDLAATAGGLLDILERLAKKEVFRNNRQLKVSFNWPLGCRFLRVICFMTYLEKLDFSECDLAKTH